MLTLSCDDDRKTEGQRLFTWTQKDPNDLQFCRPNTFNICIEPDGNPQYADQRVFSGNASSRVRSINDPAVSEQTPLTCAGLVSWKLNENRVEEFETRLRNTGCPIYTNSSGYRYTKCSFSNADLSLPISSNCTDLFLGYTADNCDFSWECSVTAYDQSYRTLCCNGFDVNVFSGTDPITGLEFRGKDMCAPNWCLSDPNLECEDVYAPCDSTASCGRHRFLTANSPAPSSDFLLNSIEIIGHGSTGKGYIQCNDIYNEVVAQAYNYISYSTNNANVVPKKHMLDVMNIIRKHCSNPLSKGNGECACINGYDQANVPFGGELESNTTLLGYQQSSVPFMAVQNANGGYRRVDAYCESGPNWVEPLSFSNQGIWTTYSNACSSTVFWTNTEYTRPTLNPIQSVFSSTNFGDVNVSSYGVLAGTEGPSNAMPLHCWLPACVGSGNGLQNHLVFPDLNALTKTCPSVCYMYSAGSDVNINDVSGNSFINIGSNFQGCSFDGQGYSSAYNPFLLKSGCENLFITAPVNFTGIINLLVRNPTPENSSLLQTRVVKAYSDIPQVSFYNDGAISMIYASKTIYKYDSEAKRGPQFSSTANLQLYVNTSHTSPFTSFQSQILLEDDLNFTQSIAIQLYVYPDTYGSGGSSFSAQVCGNIASFNNLTGAIVCSQTCDCTFGASSVSQNCPETQPLFIFPERQLIGDELIGTGTITTESLILMGASALLQSHIDLYG